MMRLPALPNGANTLPHGLPFDRQTIIPCCGPLGRAGTGKGTAIPARKSAVDPAHRVLTASINPPLILPPNSSNFGGEAEREIFERRRMEEEIYEKRRELQMRRLLRDPLEFISHGSGMKLRCYQMEAARAILNSLLHQTGLTFVVMFPRQSGKNELQAQLEAYLLTLLSKKGGEIVKVSPTWKPQSQNAMRRLEKVLKKNAVTRDRWQKESGYIYRVGQARIIFLSGAPESNIVGATASMLLEVDEAQDVLIGKFDKDIAPMAASTNATRIFWGTAWTSRTLLARELRLARSAQEKDGKPRVFTASAERVGAEVPAYARHVEEQVRRLGRSHPMVRTQYFSEEIDAEGGMFPPERTAPMKENRAVIQAPIPGRHYALLVDVAGEDEGALDETSGEVSLRNPGRDSTALTVVEVDLRTVADELIRRPTYRAVARRLWTGVKHVKLYAQIKALAEHWQARRVVVDATGVGAGLASFLERALPGRVTPFTFTSASKSQLGWDFLGIVDGGRWKESDESIRNESMSNELLRTELKGKAPDASATHTSETQYSLKQLFFQQLACCQYEILPGPEKRMRWGVPDGTRDPQTGELMHDDLVLSAALCAVLDGEEWSGGGSALIVPAGDPLREMDKGF